MDLLFTRYASPFLLLENMLQLNRLDEFIDEIIKIKSKENNDESMWELYLHHQFIDKSFTEFKKSLHIPGSDFETENNVDYENIVKESFNMSNGFVPDDEG